MNLYSHLGAKALGIFRSCVTLVALVSCLACGDKKTDSSSKTGDTPAAVAHSVLIAYKAQDWNRLAELSAPKMRAQEGELAQAISNGYRKWRKVAIESWDGKAPTTVRYGYYKGTHAESTDALVLFGSLSEREVVAVRLVLEGDAWWFGKLVSPLRTHFESMSRTLDDAYKAYDEERGSAMRREGRPRLEEQKLAQEMEMAKNQALSDELNKRIEQQKLAIELAETEADRDEARRKLVHLEGRLEKVRARNQPHKKPDSILRLSKECMDNPLSPACK